MHRLSSTLFLMTSLSTSPAWALLPEVVSTPDTVQGTGTIPFDQPIERATLGGFGALTGGTYVDANGVDTVVGLRAGTDTPRRHVNTYDAGYFNLEDGAPASFVDDPRFGGAPATDPLASAVADVNGDGLDDLVAIFSDRESVYVYLGGSSSPAVFPTRVEHTIGNLSSPFGAPTALTTADLDADGQAEVIVGFEYTAASVEVLVLTSNISPTGFVTSARVFDEHWLSIVPAGTVGRGPHVLRHLAVDSFGSGTPQLVSVLDTVDDMISHTRLRRDPIVAASGTFITAGGVELWVYDRPHEAVVDLALGPIDGGRADVVVAFDEVSSGAARLDVFLASEGLGPLTFRRGRRASVDSTKIGAITVADLDQHLTANTPSSGFAEVIAAADDQTMIVFKLNDDELLVTDGRWPHNGVGAPRDIDVGRFDDNPFFDVVITAADNLQILRVQPPPCATYVTLATHGQTFPGTGEGEMSQIDTFGAQIRERVYDAGGVNDQRRPGAPTASSTPDLCPIKVVTIAGHWELEARRNALWSVFGRGMFVGGELLPSPLTIFGLPVGFGASVLTPRRYWASLGWLLVGDRAAVYRFGGLTPLGMIGETTGRIVSIGQANRAAEGFGRELRRVIDDAYASMDDCGEVVVDLSGMSRGATVVSRVYEGLRGVAPLDTRGAASVTYLDGIDRGAPRRVWPWSLGGQLISDPRIGILDGNPTNQTMADGGDRINSFACGYGTSTVVPAIGLQGGLSTQAGVNSWLVNNGVPRGHDRSATAGFTRTPLDLEGTRNAPFNPMIPGCAQSVVAGVPASGICAIQPLPCHHTEITDYFTNIDDPLGDLRDIRVIDDLIQFGSVGTITAAANAAYAASNPQLFGFVGSTFLGELMAAPRATHLEVPRYSGFQPGANERVTKACVPTLDPGASFEAQRLISVAECGRAGELAESDLPPPNELVLDPNFSITRNLGWYGRRLGALRDVACTQAEPSPDADALGTAAGRALRDRWDADPSALPWLPILCDPDGLGLLPDGLGSLVAELAAGRWPTDGIWQVRAGEPAIAAMADGIDREAFGALGKHLGAKVAFAPSRSVRAPGVPAALTPGGSMTATFSIPARAFDVRVTSDAPVDLYVNWGDVRAFSPSPSTHDCHAGPGDACGNDSHGAEVYVRAVAGGAPVNTVVQVHWREPNPSIHEAMLSDTGRGAAEAVAEQAALETALAATTDDALSAQTREVGQVVSGASTILPTVAELPPGLLSSIGQTLHPASIQKSHLVLRAQVEFLDPSGDIDLHLSGPGLDRHLVANAATAGVGTLVPLTLSISRGPSCASIGPDDLELMGRAVRVHRISVVPNAPRLYGPTGRSYEWVSHSGGLTVEHAETFARRMQWAGRPGRLARVEDGAHLSWLQSQLGPNAPAWVAGRVDSTGAARWRDGTPVTVPVVAGPTPLTDASPQFLHLMPGVLHLVHDDSRAFIEDQQFGFLVEYDGPPTLGAVEVYASHGAGFAATPSESSAPMCGAGERCAVADVDGDARLDYVAVSGPRAFAATGTLDERTGRWAWSHDACRPGERCTWADVDGDGRDDLVAFDPAGDVSVARSGGDHLAARTVVATALCGPGVQCDAGDLNGDGRADLVAFESGTGGDVRVLLADGSSALSFGAAGSGVWATGLCLPGDVCRLGDFDGDRTEDVVVVSGPNALVAISTGGGLLVSPPGPAWVSCPVADECRLADVDGDRRADLVDLTSGQVARATPAGLVDAGIWSSISCAGRCDLADVNHDGAADLVRFTIP